MYLSNITIWLPALSLALCTSALAATVYKTVDDKGVVSFSDTLPAANLVVETVVIEEQIPPSSELTEQRLEDMRETTDRMVADRMAREKHRAELRTLDLQRSALQAQQQTPDYYDTTTVYNGYAPYPVRRQWRRPNYPQHPIPPLLHPAPVLPGATPLPGNDYPASLIRKGYDPKVRAAFQ
jgi:hypothetical protein